MTPTRRFTFPVYQTLGAASVVAVAVVMVAAMWPSAESLPMDSVPPFVEGESYSAFGYVSERSVAETNPSIAAREDAPDVAETVVSSTTQLAGESYIGITRLASLDPATTTPIFWTEPEADDSSGRGGFVRWTGDGPAVAPPVTPQTRRDPNDGTAQRAPIIVAVGPAVVGSAGEGSARIGSRSGRYTLLSPMNFTTPGGADPAEDQAAASETTSPPQTPVATDRRDRGKTAAPALDEPQPAKRKEVSKRAAVAKGPLTSVPERIALASLERKSIPATANKTASTEVPSQPTSPTSNADPDATDPHPAHEPEPYDLLAEYRSRIISFHNIGYSSSDPERHYVRAVNQTTGWPGFVRSHALPDLAWGVRRIQIHNPFGIREGRQMELDQYLHAKADGLHWLTDDFTEAWAPVVRGEHTGGERVEVIAYLGNPFWDIFADLEEAGRWDEWLDRAERCVRPAVDAGMSLGFDAFSKAERDSYAFRFVQLLETRGVRVYIETWPRKTHAHWRHTPIIVSEYWYQRNRTHPNVLRRADLTGEIVRLMAHPPSGETASDTSWIERELVDAISSGHTVSGHIDRLRRAGIKCDPLLRRARDRAMGMYD